MGTAFSLTYEQPWSDVVPLENGWAFIHLLELQSSDLAGLPTVRDSLAGEVLRAKQNNAFSQWVSDLYESANIKDYRGDLYGKM
jgi:parvulin-like peptidyl-prolyl isomerase